MFSAGAQSLRAFSDRLVAFSTVKEKHGMTAKHTVLLFRYNRESLHFLIKWIFYSKIYDG